MAAPPCAVSKLVTEPVPRMPDRLLVALEGSPDRHLGRPAQLLQQPADVTPVVADAELLFDDSGDAGGGPNLTAEAVGLRPVPEELGDQVLLAGRELGRRASPGLGPEGLGATRAGTGEPTADSFLGDIQGLGD